MRAVFFTLLLTLSFASNSNAEIKVKEYDLLEILGLESNSGEEKKVGNSTIKAITSPVAPTIKAPTKPTVPVIKTPVKPKAFKIEEKKVKEVEAVKKASPIVEAEEVKAKSTLTNIEPKLAAEFTEQNDIDLFLNGYFAKIQKCESYKCIKPYAKNNFSKALNKKIEGLSESMQDIVLRPAQKQAKNIATDRYVRTYEKSENRVNVVHTLIDADEGHVIIIPLIMEDGKWKKGTIEN